MNRGNKGQLQAAESIMKIQHEEKVNAKEETRLICETKYLCIQVHTLKGEAGGGENALFCAQKNVLDKNTRQSLEFLFPKEIKGKRRQ